jgi:hypothetical protein
MSSVLAAAVPTLPSELPARFTVGQYHAMIDAGVFAEDEGFELLEGWLFHKIAKKAIHSVTTRKLRRKLESLLAPEWDVESQEPITTLDSEPKPDVSVVRAGARDNKKRHPKPKEVAAIAEVSEGTLTRDRGRNEEAAVCTGEDSRLLDRQSGRPTNRSLHRSDGPRETADLSQQRNLQTRRFGSARSRRRRDGEYLGG